MAVTVSVTLEREFSVPCGSDFVYEVLSDVPRSVSHFPKVDQLVDLGDNAFRWEMDKIGLGKVYLQTVYACKYVGDAEANTVVWTPVDGVGNGVVNGSWHIAATDAGTSIKFQTVAELTVAVPGLMKLAITPVVKAEFAGLVDKYIGNLTKTFSEAA